MNQSKNAGIAFGGLLAIVGLSLPLLAAEEKREPIGDVLGQPVYRDQIRTEDNVPLRSELHRLFSQPVLKQYRKKHKQELTPTEAQIEAVTAYFANDHREKIKDQEAELRSQLEAVKKKLMAEDLSEDERGELNIEQEVLQTQLQPPGRSFTRFVLDNWMFQRLLYDEYGGGRILWQQAGMEAFDAMHAWLQDQEKKKKFQITDPELRTEFYKYWTTQKHGSFLTDDKERIRSEFLEPAWWPKADGVLSPNEMRVREYVDASNNRDIESMMSMVTDDVQWLSVRKEKISVETDGKVKLRESLAGYFKSAPPSATSEIEWSQATAARVAASEKASWRAKSGIQSQSSLSVYEFREGLICRVYYFPAERPPSQ